MSTNHHNKSLRSLYCSYRQSFDARHAVYDINIPEQPEGNYQDLIHEGERLE